MGISAEDQSKIRTIIQKLIANDKQWLKDQSILVGDKGAYWIVNYLQGPRTEYNGLVRGMAIQKPQGFTGDVLKLISSFPFTRFYNYGESDAAYINFSDAEMMEKMDGTMVGVFFPTNNPSDPHYHTRKMISSHKPDMDNTITAFSGITYNLMNEIGKYVKAILFNQEDVRKTFVFEFIHESSALVTKYQPSQYGLYLLTARDLDSYQELSAKELDEVAIRLRVGRPRRWDSLADFGEIKRMMQQMSQEIEDFEGFVFQDRETGNRLKLKDPGYVEKHHIITDMRLSNLLLKVLEGEEDEILACLPKAKEKIELIKEKYQQYLNYVLSKVEEWRAKGLIGRDLSVALFGENPLQKWELKLKAIRGEPAYSKKPAEPDQFIREMILKSQALPDSLLNSFVDTKLRQIALGQGTNEGNPKDLVSILGLDAEDTLPDCDGLANE